MSDRIKLHCRIEDLLKSKKSNNIVLAISLMEGQKYSISEMAEIIRVNPFGESKDGCFYFLPPYLAMSVVYYKDHNLRFSKVEHEPVALVSSHVKLKVYDFSTTMIGYENPILEGDLLDAGIFSIPYIEMLLKIYFECY